MTISLTYESLFCFKNEIFSSVFVKDETKNEKILFESM